MQTQRKRAKPEVARRVRPEFIAAVRYIDGSRDIFHIRNADDIDDARDLVMCEIGEARSVVIAQRH